MNTPQPGNQPFSTSEGMLAFCLYLAGCQFSNPTEPCFNLYDPDILFALGDGAKDAQGNITKPSRFSGMKRWDAATTAWKEKARGHVEWSFPLTGRTTELIKAYREQRKELEEADGKASDLVLKIMQSAAKGAMLPDEAILRIACVNLKIRSEFMNEWKNVVPLLRIPEKGKTEQFDTTATGRDAKGHSTTVPAKGVKKPGYVIISLNASEETKRKLKLV